MAKDVSPDKEKKKKKNKKDNDKKDKRKKVKAEKEKGKKEKEKKKKTKDKEKNKKSKNKEKSKLISPSKITINKKTLPKAIISAVENSANYNVENAVIKLKKLKTEAEINNFTKGETRVGVTRVIDRMKNSFKKK